MALFNVTAILSCRMADQSFEVVLSDREKLRSNDFVYNEDFSDEINEKLTDEVTAENVKTLLRLPASEGQQDAKNKDSVEK